MKLRKNRNIKGQSLVEYVIIVVVVAIAAIAIVGVFSDTIRQKFGGAAEALGGDSSAIDEAVSEKSADLIQEVGSDLGN
jgi:type IV pilus assembly protein PilA